MSDLHLLEDQATLYVLGRLTEAERGEFEACLAQSAELRALVRELEAGAVSVAMAAPRRRVPPQIWERIEKAVTEETRPQGISFSFWFRWLRNGWAAAAACLVGWMIYALWPAGVDSPNVAPAPLVSEVEVQPGIPTASARTESGGATPRPRAVTNTVPRTPQANTLALTSEDGALRLQNAELERQLMHLSQVLTQQQALLSEPSRMKFFQVSLVSAAAERPIVAPVSTNLQRALFFAVARELGWTPSVPLTLGGETGSTPAPQGYLANSAPTPTGQPDVDFVDLRTASNAVANPTGQSPVELEPTDTSEPPTLASTSTNAIPGAFPAALSGTNAFLAFDAQVIPTGSSFRIFRINPWGQYESLGGAVLGNNSMVVAVPYGTTSSAGGNLTIIAGTPSGSSILFNLSTPPAPQP